MIALRAFAVAMALAAVALAVPSKPEWPEQFESPFGLNVVLALYFNRSSKFYYNWPERATRIEYHHGCLPLITRKSCDLIFNPNGTYLLAPEAGKPCCMLFPGIGSIPPNFLGPFNYSNQVSGVKDFYGNKHTTNHWKGAGDFAYWTDASTGHDVQFQDGPTTVMWNWGNFVVRPQPRSIFALPNEDTCNQKCPGLEQVTPAHVMPMLGKH